MHFVKKSRCSWLVENENHTIPDVMLLWYVFPCVSYVFKFLRFSMVNWPE